jgi:hypothetical protein
MPPEAQLGQEGVYWSHLVHTTALQVALAVHEVIHVCAVRHIVGVHLGCEWCKGGGWSASPPPNPLLALSNPHRAFHPQQGLLVVFLWRELSHPQLHPLFSISLWERHNLVSFQLSHPQLHPLFSISLWERHNLVSFQLCLQLHHHHLWRVERGKGLFNNYVQHTEGRLALLFSPECWGQQGGGRRRVVSLVADEVLDLEEEPGGGAHFVPQHLCIRVLGGWLGGTLPLVLALPLYQAGKGAGEEEGEEEGKGEEGWVLELMRETR